MRLQIPTAKELTRILDATAKTGPAGVRDRALLALLAGSGLRISEALALSPRDLDLERAQLDVRNGKGGRHRVAGIRQSMVPLIAIWMEERTALGLTDDQPFFCTVVRGAGRPLTTAYYRALLIRLGKRAGFPGLHPHLLRHLNALECHRQHLPLALISQHLGHASVQTTFLYLGRLGVSEAAEAVAKLR